MSTDHPNTGHGDGKDPVHNDVSFEGRDISVGAVVKSLIYLALVLGFSLAICVYIYRYTTALAQSEDTPPMPMRHLEGPTMPPDPMLQGVPGHGSDPQQDLRTEIEKDAKENQATRWVDEKAGIAQIPVEDAMKLIVQKGLPGVTTAPAAKKP